MSDVYINGASVDEGLKLSPNPQWNQSQTLKGPKNDKNYIVLQ